MSKMIKVLKFLEIAGFNEECEHADENGFLVEPSLLYNGVDNDDVEIWCAFEEDGTPIYDNTIKFPMVFTKFYSIKGQEEAESMELHIIGEDDESSFVNIDEKCTLIFEYLPEDEGCNAYELTVKNRLGRNILLICFCRVSEQQKQQIDELKIEV